MQAIDNIVVVPQFSAETVDTDGRVLAKKSILTWHRRYSDHEGSSPRARPYHCTSVWLTLAITSNVGDSGA